MKKLISSCLIFVFICTSCQQKTEQKTAYQIIQENLGSGWNTYHTWNSLSYVHMPEGFEIAFDFKYQGHNFSGYLNRANFQEDFGEAAPKLKAMAHAWDASYTQIEIEWNGIHAVLETATDAGDLVAIIKPIQKTAIPASVIIRTGLVFNRPGNLHTDKDGNITARFSEKEFKIFPAAEFQEDYSTPLSSPYYSMPLSEVAAISTGRQRSLQEIKSIIEKQKTAYGQKALAYGSENAEVYQAISTCLAWNTIYEPVSDRVLSTVSRSWNVQRGGYGLFCWDNFFMAYMCAIDNKELAFANVIELLEDMTEEGFVPNNSQGNGRKSWDRSQPPVGGILAREIYKKYPEDWFLESVFDKLLTWNRWWMQRRYHQGMLCWGSHTAKNPYNDKAHNNHLAGVLESGLDDSPMYDKVPFDAEKGILLLHDVGLNSLYVADCEALAEMAAVLGRNAEKEELLERAEKIRSGIKSLWSEEKGIFLNRRTDNGAFVEKYSPTLFYALMARAATPEQAERMVREYFYNEAYFWGDYIMPSIARSDPAFPEQAYWRGAIWAPMNFLVYLSMRPYENLASARKDLAEKSLSLFLNEWRRKNYISENYSAFDGTGDDPRIRSHPFYSWGALLGTISFMEHGYLPAFEAPLTPEHP
ncbi:MAG: hypothetical protein JJU28_12005 [Cyclobacteriaceae bacterium]|nr:hypothetical protein [Cyclobacteriaceae bacterium]